MKQQKGGGRLSRRGFLLTLGLIATTASLIQVPNLGAAPDWIGGDYAQYVMHARNLVEGRSFDVTGYIYNPAYASLAPRAYPPGYPVLLAPVYAFYGTNLLPMRILTLAFFAGCLVLLGLLYRSHLSPSYALVGVALIGLNPRVQTLAIGVGSDIPFLFFLLGTLIALEGRRVEESTTRSVLIGVLMFVAFSIRTVGGLMAPALMLASLKRTGRLGRDTLVSLVSFAVLVVALVLWSSGSASYLDQFRPSYAALVSNALGYAQEFSALWDTGLDHLAFFELLRKGFTLYAVAAIAIGFLSRVRRSPTTMELFGVLYVLVILAWPAYQGFRFLLPVLPMAVLYLVIGARALAGRFRWTALCRATMVATILIPVASYASYYAFHVPPAERFEVTDAPSLALFSFLRETPEDAVFVFSKPRVLSLMTGHRAVANHEPRRDRDLIEYLAAVGATHLVLGPAALGHREYLDGFLRRNSSIYRSIFRNERFEVFEGTQ